MTRPGWQSSLIITVGLQWGIVLGATLLAGLASADSARSLLAGDSRWPGRTRCWRGTCG